MPKPLTTTDYTVADPNGPGTKTVMCLCKRNQLEAGQAAVEASRGTKERQ